MRTVCFCNGNIPWGGGEVWHLNAARSLARRGWRVLLLCRPESEIHARALREADITLIPFGLSRLAFLNPLTHIRLAALFRTEKADALIMNLPSDVKAAATAARSAGVRHVIYRRGSALEVRDSALNRFLYAKALTRVIVNSTATREALLARNPRLVEPERISILPNGIDIPAFDAALDAVPAPEDRPAGSGWSGARRPVILGNAGRLNRQKGQHLLLHLLRMLLDKGLDARLVIAGRGEREAELKALAGELDLRERVDFVGFMDDLAPFWAEIDLFVLSSLWEGFGNVVIEAGLARKPVFAFAVSNLPELVREGVNGRLFAP
ncbi:MAG: glycosyltransferase, partial [Desulfovibrio sp.]|nr:glycosyltransferase [Desulfovibrio sp.]